VLLYELMGAGAMRRNVYISRVCGGCEEQMVIETSGAGESNVVVSTEVKYNALEAVYIVVMIENVH
jgi:hypothetical protein